MPAELCDGVGMTRRIDLPEEEVVARYDASEPVVQITESYAVSTPVLYRILREHGQALRLPRLTPAQRGAVVTLYQTGLSDTAVAKQLGLSRASVRKVVAESGVKRPTPEELADAALRSATVQEIAQRHRSGEPVRSLAVEYGIPRNTLARYLTRLAQLCDTP